MMNLNKIQDKIIHEFESIANGLKNKFGYLRHIAKLGDFLPSSTSATNGAYERTISLSGTTRLWMGAEYKEGKIYYYGSSDNKIIRGILLLYLRVFSGRTPQEIIDTDVYFINEIQLHDYLSPRRRNDLSSILQHIRSLAATLKSKEFEVS
ncbi:MAG: SufE family protein [Niabella sp.]